MLVISRKPDQSIQIDGGITITISEVRGRRVKLGIQAPRQVRIRRTELTEAPKREAVSNAR